ncbi:MAG: LUD domain-containing protein [Bacteroidales bacterium]|jgi:hypothetical protein
MKNKFSTLASNDSIEKTVKALEKNGIQTFVYETEEEVKKKVYNLLPEKAEIMSMSSVTVDTLGISDEIMNSEKYKSVKKKLSLMDMKTQWNEMRKLGSVADYSIGSVHAVTENGEIIIASASGSQLAAYAYGTGKAIWVVGTQKIVKDFQEGIHRLYEYCLPLENERALKVYNAPSKVGKILTINSEIQGRLTLIFLKKNIGF